MDAQLKRELSISNPLLISVTPRTRESGIDRPTPGTGTKLLFFANCSAWSVAVSKARPCLAFAKIVAKIEAVPASSPSILVCGKLFATLEIVSAGLALNSSARRARPPGIRESASILRDA
jgi:hypothetical protein